MSQEKITVKLTGKNGNIFNLMSIVGSALRKQGRKDDAEHMINEVMSSHSYDDALSIIQKYVNVV